MGEQLASVAQRRFGIHSLRPEQLAAMEAVLSGRDTVVVMPTGFGKSLIYQVPALLLGQPTIVVSPLIALMIDQERSLMRRGIRAVRLDSTVTGPARREALDRITKGGPLIILTTPETLESPKTAPVFNASRPGLIAVDEAHCISEWGHDFRPAYLRIGLVRARLGQPPVLALTATATQKVTGDISVRLMLQDPLVVRAPPHRENLLLSAQVVPGNMKPDAAAKVLRRLPRPGIVYCATTVEVDNIWRALNRAQMPAARYHGKMAKIEREASQRRFMKPSKRIVMVATSAFGMGIDKPNIRYILHHQAPASLEQYVQEAGRAGRDGLPSHCVLLFDPKDLDTHRFLQRQSRASIAQLDRVATALAAWAEKGDPVTIDALALSAEVPKATCSSLVTELVDAGLVEPEPEGLVATVPPAELEDAARDLAGKLETKRRQDEQRLGFVAAYAETEECRSVFIRKYFGEESPPTCNKCDRCRVAGRAPPLELEGETDEEPRPRHQHRDERRGEGGRRKRRRRRGRGRWREEGGQPQAGQPHQGQPQVPAAPRGEDDEPGPDAPELNLNDTSEPTPPPAPVPHGARVAPLIRRRIQPQPLQPVQAGHASTTGSAAPTTSGDSVRAWRRADAPAPAPVTALPKIRVVEVSALKPAETTAPPPKPSAPKPPKPSAPKPSKPSAPKPPKPSAPAPPKPSAPKAKAAPAPKKAAARKKAAAPKKKAPAKKPAPKKPKKKADS